MDIHRRAASQVFGGSVKPYFQFDKAEGDRLAGLRFHRRGRRRAQQHPPIRRAGARIEKPTDSMNRLYVVESVDDADRHQCGSSVASGQQCGCADCGALAAQILNQGGVSGLDNLGQAAGVDPKWIVECAKDLVQNRANPSWLRVIASRSRCICWRMRSTPRWAMSARPCCCTQVPERKEGGLVDFAQALKAGQVDTLVILGGNPVYNAPADVDWANRQAQSQDGRAARLLRRRNFSAVCAWHLPLAHYLESWGDALTSDGTLVPVQPLIQPLVRRA